MLSTAQEERVLVVAPTAHDFQCIAALFGEAGLPVRSYPDIPGCCRTLEADSAGLLIVSEEALRVPDLSALIHLLDQQPQWSDLPIIVLTAKGESTAGRQALDALNGSVTLLERPLRGGTLLNAVRAGLRSRHRQYKMRDALAALQKSEQRFAAFMQHLPGAAWIKDQTGRYVYANPEAERIFSKTFSELKGKTDEQLFAPETARQFRENDRRVLAQSGAVQSTEVLRHADGVDHHSLVSKFTVPGPEGQPGCIGGVAFDITERKRAEEALVAAQAQLRIITDTMAAGVTRCSRDGRYLWVSPAYARWLKCSPEECVGRPIAEVIGPAAYEAIHPHIEQVLAGRRVEYEAQLKYLGRGLTWVNAVYAPTYDAAGQPDGWVAVVTDITQRKQAEAEVTALGQRLAADLAGMERLHEVSTRFVGHDDMQTLLDAILDAAIAITDASKGNVQLLDPASGELGITVQRGFDKAFNEFFSHIRPGEVACGTAVQTRQCVIVEDVTTSPLFLTQPRALELMLAAGVKGVICTPLSTRTGQMVGVLSVHFGAAHCPNDRDLRLLDLLARQAADLLDRTRTEEALRASEQEKRLILDSANEAIAFHDTNNTLLWANKAYLDSTGLPLSQLTGKKCFSCWGLNELCQNCPVINAIRTGEPQSAELTPHNQPHWRTDHGSWLVRSAPVKDSAGNIIGAIEVAHDITEQKRTEALLRESELFHRQTLESIPGMMFTTRPDGYCDWQSPQWTEFTGIPMTEHLGDGWNHLLHPDDRPRAYAAWRAAVEERANYDLEYRVRRHDGTYRWFKVLGRPIRNVEGRIIRWFGVALDIEDLKQAEGALQKAKEDLTLVNAALEQKVQERTTELRTAVDELEHISYSMVHDMRAPLRAMQSFATLLEEECANCSAPRTMDYLRRIRDSANRLDRLITDALNYTKVVRQELPLRNVELAGLLRGMIQTYPNLQPPAAEITLQFDKLIVFGNESLLTQCFGNLLSNAVKFVPAGVKPRVRIWAETVHSPQSPIHSQKVTSEGREPESPARPQRPHTSHQQFTPLDPQPSRSLVRIWVEDKGLGVPIDAQPTPAGT